MEDPEQKRKVIGNLFIEVFEEEAEKLNGMRWLAQGTIYPDVIESAATGSDKSHLIKSYHNLGGLPERMNVGLIEPLRELFKDEVRKLGVSLGCQRKWCIAIRSPDQAWGRAFLARLNGSTQRSYAALMRSLSKSCVSDTTTKSAKHLRYFYPVRSVGVMGEVRRYNYVVSLRAVETIDFNDGTLGASALRAARTCIQPDHQRNRWDLLSRIRHFQQPPPPSNGDDNIQVTY